MFEPPGVPREHYQALYKTLLGLPPEELRKRQQAADLTFLHEGITFTVYGSKEGTEKIFPNDLVPRIIPSSEWTKIEKGLTQRLTALNMFLRDIYHEGRILSEGLAPRELVYSCKHFRKEMRGLNVPRDIFAHIMIALVRQLKIPCRYVSGYLFHADSAKDRSPAGATHAWVEAYLGELGWVALDPTNNLPGCERHIRVGMGRDYADVPPTRGMHKGEAGSELSVMVSVPPVAAPEPADLPAVRVTRTKSLTVLSNSEFEQQFQQQQ